MKMSRTLSLLVSLFTALLLSTSLRAATISVGKPVPAVAVDDRGEIHLQADGSDAYRPWQSDSNRGRIVVQIHPAGIQ